MKCDYNDDKRIECLTADANMGSLQKVIQRLAGTNGRRAEKTRRAREVKIWFQKCNSKVKSENGMTIDQACFKLIEDGNYQPVLHHILAVGYLLSWFRPTPMRPDFSMRI